MHYKDMHFHGRRYRTIKLQLINKCNLLRSAYPFLISQSQASLLEINEMQSTVTYVRTHIYEDQSRYATIYLYRKYFFFMQSKQYLRYVLF
jgi:hypothetical protein